jgi:hypothetical protein
VYAFNSEGAPPPGEGGLTVGTKRKREEGRTLGGGQRTILQAFGGEAKQPPAKCPAWGFSGSKKFLLALQVEADPSFQEFVQVCEDNCAEDVCKHCLQWPETYHFSLWQGALTSSEAQKIRFQGEQQNLPLSLELEWHHWTAGLYLKPDGESGDRVRAGLQISHFEAHRHRLICCLILVGWAGPPCRGQAENQQGTAPPQPLPKAQALSARG